MSRGLVEELAKLARLQLSDEEVEEFTPQLEEVLKFVEKLNDVDVSQTEEVVSMNGLKTVSRVDDVVEGLDRQIFLNSSPSHNSGFVKVPKVFE